MRAAAAMAAGLLLLLAGGCSTLGYYAQAVGGQLSILCGREPIREVLADPQSPPGLKARLGRVEDMRRFAQKALLLPAHGQYTTYADIGRPFVVYNVFAAPHFSLKPKTWCYPVVGCLSYRGYFRRESALATARALKKEGWEVHLGGVAAYSTLGWFDDPILSSMARLPAAHLAEIIFHELAHRRLFVKGDTPFNEGFASFIGREGARRWLAASGREGELAAYGEHLESRRLVMGILKRCRGRLRALYAAGRPGPELARAKEAELQRAIGEYRRARAGRPGLARFGGWFGPGLNNALLSSLATYQDLAGDFRALLAGSRGDLSVFYRQVEKLAALPRAKRHAQLKKLASIQRTSS